MSTHHMSKKSNFQIMFVNYWCETWADQSIWFVSMQMMTKTMHIPPSTNVIKLTMHLMMITHYYQSKSKCVINNFLSKSLGRVMF